MQVKERRITSDKGTFEFYKGLLNMELNKYEFKILTMVLALKNDNKIYSGTLKDMCEFLGVSRNSNNIIKDTIEEMSKKDLLIYAVKGYTWTLIFNDESLKDKTILDMDLEWLDTIKKYRADKNNSVDWSNLLKVFICLIDNNNEVIDVGRIEILTNLSQSIVKKALTAINNINKQGGFGCGFTVERKRNYEVFSFNTDISKSQPKNEDEVIINDNKIAIEINSEDNKQFNEAKKKFQCTGMSVRCGYTFDFN